MKATFIILFCLLALLSCGGSDNKNDTQTTKSVNKDSLRAQNKDRVNLNFYELSIDSILAKKDLEITDTFFLALVKEDYAFIAKKIDNLEDSTWHDIDFFDNRKTNSKGKNLSLEIGIQAGYPYYLFEDMDGDSIKDILIKYDQDGRGNKYWYLFLVKPNEKNFVRIDKFEQLECPQYSLKEKKIVVTGRFHKGAHTEFYKIENDKLKFIEGVRTNPDDEIKYTTKEGFEN
jgi:hypothetical protein